MSPPENLLTSTGKPFADPPTPMAMHLADITGMSIDISAYGGMAWACINMHCGPRALALRSATPPESATLHELVRGQDGYDLRVIYPLMTASEPMRSEEHTSELQSLMRISYAVFCLKKK